MSYGLHESVMTRRPVSELNPTSVLLPTYCPTAIAQIGISGSEHEDGTTDHPSDDLHENSVDEILHSLTMHDMMGFDEDNVL